MQYYQQIEEKISASHKPWLCHYGLSWFLLSYGFLLVTVHVDNSEYSTPSYKRSKLGLQVTILTLLYLTYQLLLSAFLYFKLTPSKPSWWPSDMTNTLKYIRKQTTPLWNYYKDICQSIQDSSCFASIDILIWWIWNAQQQQKFVVSVEVPFKSLKWCSGVKTKG